MKKYFILLSLSLAFLSSKIIAQNYVPITLSGFKKDVIAENYPALNSTTGALDASDYALFSTAFTGTTSGVGSGLLNSGTYTTTTRTYQFAPYSLNNVFKVDYNLKDSLTLTTPAPFSGLSLLGLATAGDAVTDITIRFTDGTSALYSSRMFYNWTSSQPAIAMGFGKVNRATNAIYATATEPKLYAVDLIIACGDRLKNVSKIILKNTTPGVSACVFAASGVINPTFVVSSNSVTCYGGSNGNASISIINGLAPFTYLWNSTPTQTTSTARNVTTGNYSVDITDAGGCLVTKTVSVSQTTLTPVVSSISSGSLNCPTSTITALANVSGGLAPYTYTWSTIPVQTSATGTLTAGNFSVSIKDANNCIVTSTVNIAAPVIAVTVSSSTLTCGTNTNGTASISSITGGAGGPYTYTWTSIPTQTTSTVSNLGAGNYNVSVTDVNNCSVTQSFSIIAPSASIITSSVSCSTSAIGTASVAFVNGGAGGPYTYTWSSSPTQTTSTASNLSGGTYSVTIKDASGCLIVQPFTISQPAISITNSSVTCFGGSDAMVSALVNGGTAPYAYAWSSSTQTTSTLSNLSKGSYTLVVTDAAGCAFSKVFTVDGPLAISSVVSTSATTCSGINNGKASIKVISGGLAPYLYAWNTNPVQTSTLAINLASPMVYTVAIIDANNCTSYTTAIIQPEPLHVNIVATPCNTIILPSTTATLSAPGAVSYTWSTGATTPTASVAPTASNTVYSFTATTSAGCIITGSTTISTSTMQASIIVTPCNTITTSQTATLTAVNSNAVSNAWSSGQTTSSIIVPGTSFTGTVTSLSFIYTGTTSAGCLATASTIISKSTSIVCTVGIHEYESTEYALYPNPNNGSFTLKLSQPQDNAFIEMYDALGKLVLKQNLSLTETVVNTASLQNGVYFFTVRNSQSVLIRSKIVKQ